MLVVCKDQATASRINGAGVGGVVAATIDKTPAGPFDLILLPDLGTRNAKQREAIREVATMVLPKQLGPDGRIVQL